MAWKRSSVRSRSGPPIKSSSYESPQGGFSVFVGTRGNNAGLQLFLGRDEVNCISTACDDDSFYAGFPIHKVSMVTLAVVLAPGKEHFHSKKADLCRCTAETWRGLASAVFSVWPSSSAAWRRSFAQRMACAELIIGVAEGVRFCR
jgi:hypothetical protein